MTDAQKTTAKQIINEYKTCLTTNLYLFNGKKLNAY
jgi:hypothetical protein